MDLNKEKMPKHIAIIMDGNRRWAKERNLDIKSGHREGAKTLEKIVKYANEIGIEYITVYAFSTENWKRAEEEIGALMLLLKNYLDDFGKRADTENIKISVLGDINKISTSLQKSIEKAIEKTKNNTGIVFNIAFNYGGRDELIKAIQKIGKDIEDNKIKSNEITEELVEDNLYTKGQPDPDIVIRTSGEIRMSNFLTWQTVYSELIFLEKNWPDFSEEDLIETIKIYQKRNRKFGGK